MCYSSLSAGTCCLRYDMSPAKRVEIYFYAQCFSVVWLILLYWPQKNQLLQHCQVVLSVVQQDPEIPKFMTGSQEDIPELTGILTRMTAPGSEGICTMEPRAPRTRLQPGLPEFSSPLLHCLVLFCWDPECAAMRFRSLQLWWTDCGSGEIHYSKHWSGWENQSVTVGKWQGSQFIWTASNKWELFPFSETLLKKEVTTCMNNSKNNLQTHKQNNSEKIQALQQISTIYYRLSNTKLKRFIYVRRNCRDGQMLEQ